jgi:hypothetical protein
MRNFKSNGNMFTTYNLKQLKTWNRIPDPTSTVKLLNLRVTKVDIVNVESVSFKKM